MAKLFQRMDLRNFSKSSNFKMCIFVVNLIFSSVKRYHVHSYDIRNFRSGKRTCVRYLQPIPQPVSPASEVFLHPAPEVLLSEFRLSALSP